MMIRRDRPKRLSFFLYGLLVSGALLMIRAAAMRPARSDGPQYPASVLRLTGDREPFTPARIDTPFEFQLKRLLTARRGIHYGSALKLNVEPLGDKLLLVDTAARGLLLKSAELSGKDIVRVPEWILPGPGLQTGIFRILNRISADGFSMEPAVVELFQEKGFAWVDGIISTELFRPWLVRLDLHRNRLSLSPYETPDPATSSEWEANLDRNWWVVKVGVRGKPAKLLLDSGTPQTYLGEEWILRSFGRVPRRQLHADSGGVRFFEAGLWEIAVPGIAPLRTPCLFVERGQLPPPAGVAIDGVLGFDVLRGLTLEIDYRAARLYLRR